MSICTFGNIITIINDYLKEDTFAIAARVRM